MGAAIWLWTASRVATIRGAAGSMVTSPVMMPTRQPRARHSAYLSFASARVGTRFAHILIAFENVGFSSPGGCIDHDIAAGIKGADGIGLPAVRQDKFLKSGEGVGQHSEERCSARAGGQIPDALRGFAANLKREAREHSALDWLRWVTWRTAGNL